MFGVCVAVLLGFDLVVCREALAMSYAKALTRSCMLGTPPCMLGTPPVTPCMQSLGLVPFCVPKQCRHVWPSCPTMVTFSTTRLVTGASGRPSHMIAACVRLFVCLFVCADVEIEHRIAPPKSQKKTATMPIGRTVASAVPQLILTLVFGGEGRALFRLLVRAIVSLFLRV